MRKYVLFLAVLLLGLTPAVGLTQGVPSSFAGQAGPFTEGIVSSIPLLSGLGLDFTSGPGACGPQSCEVAPGCVFVPFVKAGFQKMGLNFNVPSLRFRDSVDLSFRDANMWVGAAGFELNLMDRFALYFCAEGNLQRRINVVTNENPFLGPFGIVNDVQWSGTRLQWWALDAGIGLRVCPQFFIIGGLRRDQTSLRLRDPSDIFGAEMDDGFFSFRTTERGDILTKLWIPYFGVLLPGTGSKYKGYLIYSPFTVADMKLPFSFGLDLEFLFFDIDATASRRIKINKLGQFVEAGLDYNLNVSNNLYFGLWGKFNYLRVRGKASQSVDAAFAVEIFDESEFQGAFSASDRDTATLTRFLLSGGITANLLF